MLERDPVEAARLLLGWELVFGECRARIVETEGYRGRDDAGSHAFRGVTKRTEVMFGPVGFAYLYFVYGNHWMLNVVAHEAGEVGAVLIRAARPLAGLELMRSRRAARSDRELLNGPGKLCQALGLDSAIHGVDLLGDGHLIPGSGFMPALSGPRVGLSPGKGDTFPWRFVSAEDAEWASLPRLRG